MKKIILILIFALIASYVFALSSELYLKTWVFDLSQHFIAGVLLALIWAEIKKKYAQNLTFMGTNGFVLLGSLAWEWYEFLTMRFLPDYSRRLYLSSNSVEDMLTDLTAALLGGMLVIVFIKKIMIQQGHSS